MSLSNSFCKVTIAVIIAFCLSISARAQSGNSCWAMRFDGHDAPWPGFHNRNIADAVQVSDGFVVVGASRFQVFPSRDGDSTVRTTFGGVYVAKYDFDGNLQWLDYSSDAYFNAMPTEIVTVTVDANENIYVAGKSRENALFYYNDGASSVKIAAADTNTLAAKYVSFVAKLNKNGRFIWSGQINCTFAQLAYSSNGRVVISGNYNLTPNSTANVNYKANFGQYSQHVHTNGQFAPNETQFILWLDTANGHILNRVDIVGAPQNDPIMMDMVVDANNNVICTGVHEGRMKFYAPNHADSIHFGSPSSLAGMRMYVAKYNAAGYPLWFMHDVSMFPSPGTLYGSQPHNLAVSPTGTIYLATNWKTYKYIDYSFDPGYLYKFYRKDSSFVTYPRADYNLLSISANGYFNWSARGGIARAGGLTVKNNEVVVSGYSWYNDVNNTHSCDTFYDANGTGYIHLPNVNPTIALARYDTTGHVLGVSKTGVSNGQNVLWNGGMINGNAGSFFVYGDAELTTNTDSTIFYGDTMRYNGIDGYVVKITPGVCDPAAVSNVAATQPFAVYPNPSCGNVTVTGNFSNSGSFEVLNSMGAVIFKDYVIHRDNKRERNLQLPLGLTAGMYILRYKDDKGSQACKIMIR